MVAVSEGGMSFIASREVAPGSDIQIEFADCQLLATVKHCREREYATSSEFIVGVEVHEIVRGADTWKALSQSA